MNPKNHLTRTRFTWLAYGMFAYCVYVQTLVGLLMPFVRTTLQVSYSAGALHISAYAAGMMVSGSVGPHFSHVWGRTGLFWGGGVSAACGSLGMHWARISA